MAQRSTILSHPNKEDIDRALLADESLGTISKRFGISKTVLHRYFHKYFPKQLSLQKAEKQIEAAEDTADLVGKWYREISELYEQAKEQQDIRLALSAIDRALKCIELVQKRDLGGQGGQTVIINYLPCHKPWERNVNS